MQRNCSVSNMEEQQPKEQAQAKLIYEIYRLTL